MIAREKPPRYFCGGSKPKATRAAAKVPGDATFVRGETLDGVASLATTVASLVPASPGALATPLLYAAKRSMALQVWQPPWPRWCQRRREPWRRHFCTRRNARWRCKSGNHRGLVGASVAGSLGG